LNKEPKIYSFLKWFNIVAIIVVCTLLGNVRLVAQEERDPFISILDLKKQRLESYKNRIDLSKVILKGIIWNDKQSVAIINDELVMAGDEWQGYKLERIDRDGILLSDGENTYQLNITEEMPLLRKDNLTTEPERSLENEMTNRQEGLIPEEHIEEPR